MEDETVKLENGQEQNADYIAALAEMREKTVSKELYAKLKEENAQLLRSLINGETIEAEATSTAPDVDQLRKDLFGGEGQFTNLEYVTKALELRDAVIEQGRPDPFLPIGHQIAPTPADLEAATRVAKVLQECVDAAEGDSDLFTSLLMRETVDTPIPKTKK